MTAPRPRPLIPPRPPGSLPPPPLPLPPVPPCRGLPGRRFLDAGVLLGLGHDAAVLDDFIAMQNGNIVIVGKVHREIERLAADSDDTDVADASKAVLERFQTGALPSPLELTQAELAFADTLHDQLGQLTKISPGASAGECHVLAALLKRGDRMLDMALFNDQWPSRLARSFHGVATRTVAGAIKETVCAQMRTLDDAYETYSRAIAVSGVTANMRASEGDFACTCQLSP